MLITEMRTTNQPSLIVMTPGYHAWRLSADWRWRHLPRVREGLRKSIAYLKEARAIKGAP